MREPAKVRIRIADTDALGVVYYGNYLAFLETGRIEALRQVGLYGQLGAGPTQEPSMPAPAAGQTVGLMF